MSRKRRVLNYVKDTKTTDFLCLTCNLSNFNFKCLPMKTNRNLASLFARVPGSTKCELIRGTVLSGQKRAARFEIAPNLRASAVGGFLSFAVVTSMRRFCHSQQTLMAFRGGWERFFLMLEEKVERQETPDYSVRGGERVRSPFRHSRWARALPCFYLHIRRERGTRLAFE